MLTRTLLFSLALAFPMAAFAQQPSVVPAGMHLRVGPDATIQVLPRSRASERTLGAAILVGGWATGLILGGIGLALAIEEEAHCHSFCLAGVSEAIAIGGGLGLGAVASALGGPLLALGDDVRVVVGEQGRAPRELAPDVPEGRVLGSIGLELGTTVALLAPAIALGGNVFPLVASSLAAALGPLMVTLAGALSQSRGNFGGALLGALVAIAVELVIGIIPALSADQVADGVTALATVAIPVGLIGAIVGYEIANGEARRSAERGEQVSAPSVLPTVTALPSGVGVGVVGTF